jgi:nucleoid DNA-binding protein
MTEKGRVIRQKMIYRKDLRANPRRLFVFGDNMVRQGYGGQAAAMRGEPNAIGVPTKWRPDIDLGDFFEDGDLNNSEVKAAIDDAFDAIRNALAEGRDVVIPTDGLGTGLAELPQRAPKIHAYIESKINQVTIDPS